MEQRFHLKYINENENNSNLASDGNTELEIQNSILEHIEDNLNRTFLEENSAFLTEIIPHTDWATDKVEENGTKSADIQSSNKQQSENY